MIAGLAGVLSLLYGWSAWDDTNSDNVKRAISLAWFWFAVGVVSAFFGVYAPQLIFALGAAVIAWLFVRALLPSSQQPAGGK